MIGKKTLFTFTFVLMLGVVPAAAHDGSSHPATEPAGKVATTPPSKTAISEEERARKYFTDLPVVTHEGKTARFFTDVLRDRVVLITFFYTDCKGICPVTNQKLSNVQDLLGDRLGKDIFLVTISVDPKTDTPEVLQKYRKHYEAKEGWIFLTGDKGDIDEITSRMGQTYSKEAHLPLILMGNVKKAHWKKLRPNIPEAAIALQLKELADDNLTATN